MCIKLFYRSPVPPILKGFANTELSVDVLVCRPSSGRRWNNLEEAGVGRATPKHLSSAFVSGASLCARPKELSDLWCGTQQLGSKRWKALCTIRSAPHTQAAVSTHDTRRQRMSHFTHSWKEQCVSLCHLELLLSAGVWCVERKGWRSHHGLVWGPLLPRLKSLSGQGLSYLQKRGKLKG